MPATFVGFRRDRETQFVWGEICGVMGETEVLVPTFHLCPLLQTFPGPILLHVSAGWKPPPRAVPPFLWVAAPRTAPSGWLSALRPQRRGRHQALPPDDAGAGSDGAASCPDGGADLRGTGIAPGDKFLSLPPGARCACHLVFNEIWVRGLILLSAGTGGRSSVLSSCGCRASLDAPTRVLREGCTTWLILFSPSAGIPSFTSGTQSPSARITIPGPSRSHVHGKTPFCFSGTFSSPGNGACPSKNLFLRRNSNATWEASAAGASQGLRGEADPAGQGGDVWLLRVQQTSRPPQRDGGWRVTGQSCLWSAALLLPNLPGEGRANWAEQPAVLCGVSKASPLPKLLWGDGASASGGRAGKSEHKCTVACFPCPHASPGKISSPRQAPCLAVASGGYR